MCESLCNVCLRIVELKARTERSAMASTRFPTVVVTDPHRSFVSVVSIRAASATTAVAEPRLRVSLLQSSSSSSSCSSSSSSSRSFSFVRIAKVPRGFRSRRNRRIASARSESGSDEKIPFGYTRKDVIIIGFGILVFGVALKYGLEYFGVDSIRSGNIVQLVVVLGLTIGWISTYVFRVSSKDMTYAKQLKDYENKVMQKRLDELPEAELESMLAQIEEDKKILRENRDKRSQ